MEPFNFRKQPFGIMTTYLNKIVQEINVCSSLLKLFNSFGDGKILSKL